MELKDLKVGKIYKCALSGLKTLVIKETEQVPVADSVKEGAVPKMKEQIKFVGKIAVKNTENGAVQYFYNELYDGQLVEFNKEK